MKNLLGCLGGIITYLGYITISLLVMCILAWWLCNIDPDKTYTWYSGIWQGMFTIPNWIRSLFFSNVLYKANLYTAGYNFWWLIMLIFSVLGIIGGGRGR